jgi:hypothetical protein
MNNTQTLLARRFLSVIISPEMTSGLDIDALRFCVFARLQIHTATITLTGA